MTNASAKKRELFYHGVGSPTSQVVVDFELRGADALADLLSRRFAPVKILPIDPAPLSAVSGSYGAQVERPLGQGLLIDQKWATDKILHDCRSGPGMFRLAVTSVSWL